MWLPKELFWVVVTIRPARANSEMDRIMRAIRISIKLKPLDCLRDFNMHLPMKTALGFDLAKPIPTDFLSQKERQGKKNANNLE
jgi:hypothetical protein